MPKYLHGFSRYFMEVEIKDDIGDIGNIHDTLRQFSEDREELIGALEVVFNVSIFDTVVNSDEELRKWCDKTYSALYIDLHAGGIYDLRQGGFTVIGEGICYLREA